MARQNNTKDVSTVRGIKGGYMFVAPVANAEGKYPVDYTSKLDEVWENVGFISEDGFTEGLDSDTPDPIVDINGDTVDAPDGTHTETIEMMLISMNKDSLSVQYGHENVTDENGMITVDHNWSKASEELGVVLDLVLKNGRRWRKVVKTAKVTELGEFNGKSTAVGGRNVKMTYLADDTGSNAKDYIESTETTLDLSSMTKEQLVAYATARGIEVPSNATKEDIIALING